MDFWLFLVSLHLTLNHDQNILLRKFLNIYLFVWLCWVLVVVCRIFNPCRYMEVILSCGLRTQLWHVGSGSVSRDWTQAPLRWECGVLATGPPQKSLRIPFLSELFSPVRTLVDAGTKCEKGTIFLLVLNHSIYSRYKSMRDNLPYRLLGC